jgi:integrase
LSDLSFHLARSRETAGSPGRRPPHSSARHCAYRGSAYTCHCFILLGLYTGARKEAILSLRWSQVDLNVGRIDFNALGARRTNKRRAHIPIPPRMIGPLRRARLRGTEIGFVVNDDGKRLGDLKRGFASACRRAGLIGVTPHTLRHTCATWLMQRGVPKWEAAGFLGMSVETLEAVYGHHSPDYLKTAAEAFA